MPSVLFVCVGNVCRSPLAERLLAQRLAERGAAHWRVASAGIGARVGDPMHPRSAQDLRDLGGDPAGFSARSLTPAIADEADLVLCATKRIRSSVLGEIPAALQRTFTIVEFTRLVRPLSTRPPGPPRPIGDLVRQMAERRSDVAHLDLDIVDPIRRSERVFTEVASALDSSVQVLATTLSRHVS